jgi:hypothetical protein
MSTENHETVVVDVIVMGAAPCRGPSDSSRSAFANVGRLPSRV